LRDLKFDVPGRSPQAAHRAEGRMVGFELLEMRCEGRRAPPAPMRAPAAARLASMSTAGA
jgi:hypothetical protein